MIPQGVAGAGYVLLHGLVLGFFDRTVVVPSLSATGRGQALRALAAHSGVSFAVKRSGTQDDGVDFRDLAVKTEGYSLKDLATLVERVVS